MSARIPRRALFVTVIAFFSAPLAWAHVGSPDVYAEGSAGPYKLSVVIRPPLVIPGVAEVDVRAESPGVEHIAITPLALVGEASKHPPTSDAMKTTTADRSYFTGQLWIMAPGSWQIRLAVDGSQGHGLWSVPLPAAALGIRKMQPGLGALLAILGVILVIGLTGIVGAAAREAQLAPGETASATRRRGAFVSMTVTFAVLAAAVLLGNLWWKTDAASYAAGVYKPLAMRATLRPGNLLDLRMSDPDWVRGWVSQRRLDDFIPDHNHLMHLYLVRWPQLDVVFHLHPQPVATGEFQLALPSMPAGDYRMYADVVHANGFPETLVASATLPAISGRALTGDDAEGEATAVQSATATSTHFLLPDGYAMIWKRPAALVAKAPEDFTFTLLDRGGHPAPNTRLYMGMLGHAAFLKTDGTVFAHIHPSGTMAMAALMMAQQQTASSPAPGNNDPAMQTMPGMAIASGQLPSSVSFPYGFPTPGQYRIFVQMKHGDTIETGIFDANVAPPSPKS
jgi:hypothetical protein